MMPIRNIRASSYRQSYQTGQLAEMICILRLWLTGWKLLRWRWKCPSGEIDLIAQKGRTIAFIEVKARRSHEEGLFSISATQQQRIQQAAQLWLAKNPKKAGANCQFDVMTVSIWPWPKRYKNAFQAW